MALSESEKREVSKARHDIANWEEIIRGYESRLRTETDEGERRYLERQIAAKKNEINGLRSEIRYSYGISI